MDPLRDPTSRALLLRRALLLARSGVGAVEPNPAVGALVVAGGRIVGEGRHAAFGAGHAEVAALRDAAGDARGADLVVTLEPCSTTGKTPPCADAIAEAGIRRVLCGAVDPDLRHRGRGLETLRARGIEVIAVEEESLAGECRAMLGTFPRFAAGSLPFVLLKLAATLDGRAAAASGDARWITGEAARREVHIERARCDAIVTGVGTVLADDPMLLPSVPRIRPGIRVVLDSALRTPPGCRMVRTAREHPTLVCTARGDAVAAEALRGSGVEVMQVPADDGGRVDIRAVLLELRRRGHARVLVEAGPRVAGACLAAGLVDRVRSYIAPCILGDAGAPASVTGLTAPRMADALRLRDPETRRAGDDVVVEGWIEKPDY